MKLPESWFRIFKTKRLVRICIRAAQEHHHRQFDEPDLHTYDKSGNIRKINSTATVIETRNFTYDTLDRLVTANAVSNGGKS